MTNKNALSEAPVFYELFSDVTLADRFIKKFGPWTDGEKLLFAIVIEIRHALVQLRSERNAGARRTHSASATRRANGYALATEFDAIFAGAGEPSPVELWTEILRAFAKSFREEDFLAIAEHFDTPLPNAGFRRTIEAIRNKLNAGHARATNGLVTIAASDYPQGARRAYVRTFEISSHLVEAFETLVEAFETP